MDGFPLRVRSARANRREVRDLSEGVRRRQGRQATRRPNP